ncbi:hypothetical protein [Nonomuraea sp. SYSU D8015]|uniref:hypothetical protein n=1 Tax=Nonomuraea sp. SYSU D8015 TaxID=2593644 RepID=UPI001CB6B9DF|nr:hypothetical protein [Nonomuraea sp. SYSU D8015]
MLIYHFGTRDQLLRAVITEARTRQLVFFREALAPREEPYTRTLKRAWQVLTGPEGSSYVRLFAAVYNAPGREALLPDFQRAATTDWLDLLEQCLRPHCGVKAPAVATAVLALVRGLLMDADATGDTVRVEAAFAAFIDLLAPWPAWPTGQTGELRPRRDVEVDAE